MNSINITSTTAQTPSALRHALYGSAFGIGLGYDGRAIHASGSP